MQRLAAGAAPRRGLRASKMLLRLVAALVALFILAMYLTPGGAPLRTPPATSKAVPETTSVPLPTASPQPPASARPANPRTETSSHEPPTPTTLSPHTATSPPPAESIDDLRSGKTCFTVPYPEKPGIANPYAKKGETIDVLGEQHGVTHYCILTNVCVNPKDGSLSLFDPDREGESFPFPIRVENQDHATIYTNDPHSLKTAKQTRTLITDGLSIVLRPSECCNSLRAMFEPIPSLWLALADFRGNKTRQQEAGIFKRADAEVNKVVIATSHLPSTNGTLQPWSDWMINLAVAGGNPKAHLKRGAILQLHREYANGQVYPRCFRRVLVPGAVRGFFPHRYAARDFRREAYARLSAMKKSAVQAGENPWYMAHEGPNGFVKQRRVILFAVRNGARSITDMHTVNQLIERKGADAHAAVKLIDFGSHPLISQATHAQEADMLVGVTGSDFMNMVFMSADSLVLELNPVFYATDVFRTMADVSGLQYLAWTCTAPTCAFDEDRRQWGKMVAALGVTIGKRRDIQLRIGAAEAQPKFTWPAVGDPMRTCPQCAALVRSYNASTMIMVRDSRLKVERHLNELERALSQAFSMVGWFEYEIVPVTPAPRRR
jgi:hypothetical protein